MSNEPDSEAIGGRRRLVRRRRLGGALAQQALHQQAAARLRELIIHGVLAPGERIVEQRLCADLGISRTPLREALKLLAAEGLVALRLNRGARIMPMDGGEIVQLFDVLSGIERMAAEMAAERRSPAALRRLEVLQRRIEDHHASGDRAGYFAANQRIHRSIVEMTRNDVLIETHGRLIGRAERARFLALGSSIRWAESVAEHRAVLDALAAGDAEVAGRLLADHVAETGAVVSAALDNQKTIAA